MRIRRAMVGAVGLTLLATLPAEAGKVYAVHTAHNFCPAGLQPVTMDGSICSGKPNQDVTYQQVMSYSVKRAPCRHASDALPDCGKGRL